MLRTIQDDIFSKIIRKRDNYTCQRCGGSHLPNSSGLHNSHFFTRGLWNTRYDHDNCTALCYGCHRYFDQNKRKYREFKIRQLGKKKFEALEIRSNMRGDKKFLRSKLFTKILRQELKNLEKC